MARFINPTTQYLDAAGNPLAFGLLYFFDSGTNDDKKTFKDINETIENTQPLVLTGDGRVPNCFYSGSAKVILTDADDVQFWERDPVFTAQSSSFGAAWDAITIYSKNDAVTLNDLLYVSLIDANQNNNPSSSPGEWELSQFITGSNISIDDESINSNANLDLSQVDGAGVFEKLFARMVRNGAFEAYFSGVKRFETTSSGTRVEGTLIKLDATGLSANSSLTVVSDEAGGGSIFRNVAAGVQIQKTNTAGSAIMPWLIGHRTGATELHHDGNKKIETTATGTTTTGQAKVTEAAPAATNDLTRKDYVDLISSVGGQLVAVASANISGFTPTINSEIGVTGVVRTAAGNYLVTLDEAISGTDYAVHLTQDSSGAGNGDTIRFLAAGTNDVRVHIKDGTGTLVDGDFCITVFKLV